MLGLPGNVHSFMHKGSIVFTLGLFKKIGNIQTSELYHALPLK